MANKTRHYFQPSMYYDDGTNIEWRMPSELHSFEAFESEDDLREFMDSHGYRDDEYTINEYFDDDIEGVTILDCTGDVVEVNEDGEDFVTRVYGRRAEAERLREEAFKLDIDIKREITEYGEANRKFKDGDIVNYTQEHYRVPRKYIVRSLEYTIVADKEVKIFYKISTANGHAPNGGWSVSESDLVPSVR